MIKLGVATVRFPIASVRRLTMQGNRVFSEEKHSHIEKQEREEYGVGGTRQRLLAEGEDVE